MARPSYQNQLLAFDADLDAFAQQLKIDLSKVVRRVAIDLHDRIVQRTPVLHGRARASWTMSIDSEQGAGDVGEVKLSGSEAAQRAKATQAVLAALDQDPYRQVWIFNNVIYILPLEHGHSAKAPDGMVAVSLAAVEAGIDAALGRGG